MGHLKNGNKNETANQKRHFHFKTGSYLFFFLKWNCKDSQGVSVRTVQERSDSPIVTTVKYLRVNKCMIGSSEDNSFNSIQLDYCKPVSLQL